MRLNVLVATRPIEGKSRSNITWRAIKKALTRTQFAHFCKVTFCALVRPRISIRGIFGHGILHELAKTPKPGDIVDFVPNRERMTRRIRGKFCEIPRNFLFEFLIAYSRQNFQGCTLRCILALQEGSILYWARFYCHLSFEKFSIFNTKYTLAH